MTVDLLVRHWLLTQHTAVLNTVMMWASWVGGSGAIWLALGAALAIAYPARTAGAVQLALALLVTCLLTDGIMKPLVGRERPYTVSTDGPVLIVPPPESASFPSGHAALAFAGAYALSHVWRRARWLLWSLASLIAVSRVYVGVHYPSDVIGGAVVGLACAVFVVGGTAWYDFSPAAHDSTVPR